MRGKKSERIILQKMLQYCDEIEQILKKHRFNREEFENDKEFQFACGMRNIYAHDYDIVDNDIIWETITKEIPELKEKLQIIFSTV